MVEERKKVKFAYLRGLRFVVYGGRGCNPSVGLARDILEKIKMAP